MKAAYKKEIWRSVKFVLFSISAGAIEIISFAFLYDLLHMVYWASYLIALILSVIWNFTLNRKFTFKSASNIPKAMLLVFAFYCVFTPITTIGGSYLEGTYGWNGDIVTLLSMALNLITEFLYDRFVVFGKTVDTNEAAKKGKESAVK